MIYAVEGPSGAGKDTYINNHFKNKENTVVFERPTFPRMQSKGMGAWSESAETYKAIVAATLEPEYDYVSNRFLIGTWVYRALQFNNGTLHPQCQEAIARSYIRLCNTALAEAVDRAGYSPTYTYPWVTIILLLPSQEQLEEQRKYSGKEYPYRAYDELLLYSLIKYKIINNPINGIILRTLTSY